MQWINSEIDVKLLRDKFVKAKPFPHIIIRNFLNSDKAELLAKEIAKEDFTFKDSDLFQLYQTNDLENSSSRVLREFHSLAKSKEFAKMMSDITGIKLVPGALDLAGSLYKPGNYLLCHDDRVENRKLAWIIYLSKGFEVKDGARFVIFDNKKGKPNKEKKYFVPEWNSIMIFEVSNLSFHSVEENLGQKDRFAIGGWLH